MVMRGFYMYSAGHVASYGHRNEKVRFLTMSASWCLNLGQADQSFGNRYTPTVDHLMVDTAGVTHPVQRLYPIQTQWPPPYLGSIPDPHTEPLTVAGLEHIREGAADPISSSDRLEGLASDNHLLAIWLATRQRIGNYDYLVLPPGVSGEADSTWVESHHTRYPSNKIMVRKSYEKAFTIFLKENAESYRGASHLALGGTSGIGKTFCCRYIIWRLFHPDGVEILTVPDTIFFWSTPKDMTG